jgi:hypothetical protein
MATVTDKTSSKSIKLYLSSWESFAAVHIMGICRAATRTMSTASGLNCSHVCSSSTHIFRLIGVDSISIITPSEGSRRGSAGCRGSRCERMLSIATRALLWMDPST